MKLIKKETLKRGLKYIIQTLVIFLAAKLVPKGKLTLKEVTMIAIVGAIGFAVLDMYSPTVSDMGRKVNGLTLGVRGLTS